MEKAIAEIKYGRRPLPFSVEVFRKKIFFGKAKSGSSMKHIFDW